MWKYEVKESSSIAGQEIVETNQKQNNKNVLPNLTNR